MPEAVYSDSTFVPTFHPPFLLRDLHDILRALIDFKAMRVTLSNKDGHAQEMSGGAVFMLDILIRSFDRKVDNLERSLRYARLFREQNFPDTNESQRRRIETKIGWHSAVNSLSVNDLIAAIVSSGIKFTPEFIEDEGKSIKAIRLQVILDNLYRGYKTKTIAQAIGMPVRAIENIIRRFSHKQVALYARASGV